MNKSPVRKLHQRVMRLEEMLGNTPKFQFGGTCSAVNDDGTINVNHLSVDVDGNRITSTMPNIRLVGGDIPDIGDAVLLVNQGGGKVFCMGRHRSESTAMSTIPYSHSTGGVTYKIQSTTDSLVIDETDTSITGAFNVYRVQNTRNVDRSIDGGHLWLNGGSMNGENVLEHGALRQTSHVMIRQPSLTTVIGTRGYVDAFKGSGWFNGSVDVTGALGFGANAKRVHSPDLFFRDSDIGLQIIAEDFGTGLAYNDIWGYITAVAPDGSWADVNFSSLRDIDNAIFRLTDPALGSPLNVVIDRVENVQTLDIPSTPSNVPFNGETQSFVGIGPNFGPKGLINLEGQILVKQPSFGPVGIQSMIVVRNDPGVEMTWSGQAASLSWNKADIIIADGATFHIGSTVGANNGTLGAGFFSNHTFTTVNGGVLDMANATFVDFQMFSGISGDTRLKGHVGINVRSMATGALGNSSYAGVTKFGGVANKIWVGHYGFFSDTDLNDLVGHVVRGRGIAPYSKITSVDTVHGQWALLDQNCTEARGIGRFNTYGDGSYDTADNSINSPSIAFVSGDVGSQVIGEINGEIHLLASIASVSSSTKAILQTGQVLISGSGKSFSLVKDNYVTIVRHTTSQQWDYGMMVSAMAPKTETTNAAGIGALSSIEFMPKGDGIQGYASYTSSTGELWYDPFNEGYVMTRAANTWVYDFPNLAQKFISWAHTTKLRQQGSFSGTGPMHITVAQHGWFMNDAAVAGTVDLGSFRGVDMRGLFAGDTYATTMHSIRDYNSTPSVWALNGGTLVLSNGVYGYVSGLYTTTGVTVPVRVGVQISDLTGNGTVIRQTAINIDSLVAAGSGSDLDNIGISNAASLVQAGNAYFNGNVTFAPGTTITGLGTGIGNNDQIKFFPVDKVGASAYTTNPAPNGMIQWTHTYELGGTLHNFGSLVTSGAKFYMGNNWYGSGGVAHGGGTTTGGTTNMHRPFVTNSTYQNTPGSAYDLGCVTAFYDGNVFMADSAALYIGKFNQTAWSNPTLIAVGTGGEILGSTDGSTWTGFRASMTIYGKTGLLERRGFWVEDLLINAFGPYQKRITSVSTSHNGPIITGPWTRTLHSLQIGFSSGAYHLQAWGSNSLPLIFNNDDVGAVVTGPGITGTVYAQNPKGSQNITLVPDVGGSVAVVGTPGDYVLSRATAPAGWPVPDGTDPYVTASTGYPDYIAGGFTSDDVGAQILSGPGINSQLIYIISVAGGNATISGDPTVQVNVTCGVGAGVATGGTPFVLQKSVATTGYAATAGATVPLQTGFVIDLLTSGVVNVGLRNESPLLQNGAAIFNNTVNQYAYGGASGFVTTRLSDSGSSPHAVAHTNTIGIFSFGAQYDGTAGHTALGGWIAMTAREPSGFWSAGNTGTRMSFAVTPTGSTGPVTAVRIEQDKSLNPLFDLNVSGLANLMGGLTVYAAAAPAIANFYKDAAVLTDTAVGTLNFYGGYGTAGAYSLGASITILAGQDWTSGHAGTRISLKTVDRDTLILVTRGGFDSDGYFYVGAHSAPVFTVSKTGVLAFSSAGLTALVSSLASNVFLIDGSANLNSQTNVVLRRDSVTLATTTAFRVEKVDSASATSTTGLASGHTLGLFRFGGNVDNVMTIANGAGIRGVTEGAWTASAGTATANAARLEFLTALGTTLAVKALIDSNGIFYVGPTAAGAVAYINTTGAIISVSTGGIGYGAGAGGAVTQITTKATGVTLNKTTGKITMEATTVMANNNTQTFVLTNSTITANDMVLVNVIGGAATPGSYIAWASAEAAGSCSISVRNLSGGSLTEAPVLLFAVIKGAIT